MNAMTSNDKRAALRRAITQHENWDQYKAIHGVTAADLSSLAECERILTNWGVDPASVFAAHAVEALPELVDVPPVKGTPVKEEPDDAMAALLTLKRALGGSVDAEAVKAIVEEAVAPIRAQVADAAPVILTVDRDGLEVAKVEGLRHMTFETLLKACTARDASGRVPNVWLSGPSQSGKTTAASQVAEALGLGFDFHGAMEMSHELLGFVDANGRYHETAFVRRFRDGGVCLLDECDGWASEATLALNAALANGMMALPNGEHVKRHNDFICIAAGNTWGAGATADYIGRNKLDGAFMQRFPVKLTWAYDWKLVTKFSGDPEFAARVKAANKAAEKSGLKVLITPAHAKAGAALIACGFSQDEAASMTYLAELSDDQRKQVEA